MEWYLKVLRNYAGFSGRARRKEFWMFALVSFGIAVGLGLVDLVLTMILGFSALNSLYSLAVLIPSIAVGVRRLHDTGRSGWWWLIGFVPVIGFIVLLVFAVQEGNRGDNAYGPDPKGGFAS